MAKSTNRTKRTTWTSWSAEEDEYIYSNWHNGSITAIAAKLGRSRTACILRAFRLGISKVRRRVWTTNDVRRLRRLYAKLIQRHNRAVVCHIIANKLGRTSSAIDAYIDYLKRSKKWL